MSKYLAALSGLLNPVYNLQVNSREIIRRLKADGWYKVSQKGSHLQLKHPEKPGRVTVPHPERNLPVGT